MDVQNLIKNCIKDQINLNLSNRDKPYCAMCIVQVDNFKSCISLRKKLTACDSFKDIADPDPFRSVSQIGSIKHDVNIQFIYLISIRVNLLYSILDK